MIRIVVTDIEGTTSSIRFVHEVLFPYAAEHLDDFIRAHRDEPAVRAQLDAVANEAGLDAADVDALVAQLQAWIREDRKVTPLKALQGMVWRQGYERGDFLGHVYADAAAHIRRWHDRGLRLYIYSSGSVEAQQWLFGHSEDGDLTPFFSGYFDTRIGGKREPASYRRILEELGVEPATVLFLSDIEEELDAAADSGMATCWLVREQEPEQPAPGGSGHKRARDFAEVDRMLLTH